MEFIVSVSGCAVETVNSKTSAKQEPHPADRPESAVSVPFTVCPMAMRGDDPPPAPCTESA